VPLKMQSAMRSGTQRLCALFAQHPGDRVHNIDLPHPLGPTMQVSRCAKGDLRLFAEHLKPRISTLRSLSKMSYLSPRGSRCRTNTVLRRDARSFASGGGNFDKNSEGSLNSGQPPGATMAVRQPS